MPPLLRSLAAQIIALILGLLLTVQLVSFVVLRNGIDSNAHGTIVTELRKGERVWRRLSDDAAHTLGSLAARAAMAEPLRAAVASTDKDAVAIAAGALERDGSSELHLAVLQGNGTVLFTQDTHTARIVQAWRAIAPLPAIPGAVLVWLDRTPHWVVTAAIPAPGLTRQAVGHVLITTALARELVQDAQSLTSLQFTVLTRPRGGSWLEAWTSDAASRRTAALVQALAGDDKLAMAGKEWTFNVGEDWLARAVPLTAPGSNQEGALVLLRSVDEAAAHFARLQMTLAALVAVGAVVTITGGVLLARRLTRPLSVLAEAARRVGRGDYERQIGVSATHEVAELASALEGMRSGIRDRDNRITQLAYTDALTNLPNRQQFLRLVEQRLKPSMQTPGACAVLILNLDRFHLVNEALGRAFGDRLLREVGKRLGEVRAHGKDEQDNDVVARLGGDTFAVLLANPDLPAVLLSCRKILRAFEKPVRLDEHRIDLSAGIGAAVGPGHGADVDLLVGRAEIAMQMAKQEHVGYRVFEAAMETASPSALSLLGELRQAVDRQQLRLYLQPRINLATQKITGAEALMRWQHPKRGMVMPADFIKFAEQTGFMRRLTAWMLDAVALAAKHVQEAGLNMRVGINLSTRDLVDDLPERLRQTLQRHDVAASALCVEITETAMMDDPQSALRALQALADMGCELSIDDFGTGYTSLSYLKRLPVHELKVDKSFVMRMEHDADDAKIVRSAIELAHNLGLSVVAEGVETAAAWKMLSALGCDEAQGYVIAEPMPVDEFVGWVQRWRGQGAGPHQATPDVGQQPAAPAEARAEI